MISKDVVQQHIHSETDFKAGIHKLKADKTEKSASTTEKDTLKPDLKSALPTVGLGTAESDSFFKFRKEAAQSLCKTLLQREEREAGDLREALKSSPLSIIQACTYIVAQSLTIPEYLEKLTLYRERGMKLDTKGSKESVFAGDESSTDKMLFLEKRSDTLCLESIDAKRALEYYERARQIQEQAFGQEHAIIADCYICLGNAAKALGDGKRAADAYTHAVKIRQKVLGENHVSIAECMKDLGLIYLNLLNDPKQAHRYFLEAVIIYREHHMEESNEVATVSIYCGVANQKLNIMKGAKSAFELAWQIFEKNNGSEDISVGFALDKIGETLVDSEGGAEAAAKAITYHQRAVAIYEKVYGSVHNSLPDILDNLGRAYLHLKDFKNAIENFERARVIREKILGQDNITVAESYLFLGSAYSDSGKIKQAMDCFEKAHAIRAKLFGQESVYAIEIWKKLEELKKIVGPNGAPFTPLRQSQGSQAASAAASKSATAQNLSGADSKTDSKTGCSCVIL